MKGCDGSRQALEGSEPTEERNVEEASERSLRDSPKPRGIGDPPEEGYFVRQG